MDDRTLARFWAKVHVTDYCWEWVGAKGDHGYGNLWVGKRRTDPKSVGAHRLSYEHFVGPIPDGLHIDHLCRNRGCVNPQHLEPVTCHENILRGDGGKHWAAKTHCPQGHPYNEANTRWRTDRPNSRECRICHYEVSREYRRRQGQRDRSIALTQCKRGHPYDEINTYLDKHGRRQCRACKAERQRSARLKAAR